MSSGHSLCSQLTNMATHHDSEPPSKKQRQTEDVPTDSDQYSDEDNIAEELPYKIEKVSHRIARKFGVEEVRYTAKLNSEHFKNKKLLDVGESLKNMFDDMITEAASSYNDDDKVRMTIEHQDLKTPVVIHLQSKHNVTAEKALER